LAIMAFFSAKLLMDLVALASTAISPHSWATIPPERRHAAVAASGVLLATLLMVLAPAQAIARDMLMETDATPIAFAQYLDGALPPGAVIESFEPEIVFLSQGNFRFRQPPLDAQSLAIRHVQLGTPLDRGGYEVQGSEAQFLVVGRFAKLTGFYDPDLQTGAATLVNSIGLYDLYRLRQPESD